MIQLNSDGAIYIAIKVEISRMRKCWEKLHVINTAIN